MIRILVGHHTHILQLLQEIFYHVHYQNFQAERMTMDLYEHPLEPLYTTTIALPNLRIFVYILLIFFLSLLVVR